MGRRGIKGTAEGVEEEARRRVGVDVYEEFSVGILGVCSHWCGNRWCACRGGDCQEGKAVGRVAEAEHNGRHLDAA